MNDEKANKPKDTEPVKKANPDPVKEALGHPDGPSLQEMLDGEEEKVLKKKSKPQNDSPEDGPVPVI